MHISIVNILKMKTGKTAIAIKCEIMYWVWAYLHLTLTHSILNVKVKLIHILTLNIVEMVTDRKSITTAIK